MEDVKLYLCLKKQKRHKRFKFHIDGPVVNKVPVRKPGLDLGGGQQAKYYCRVNKDKFMLSSRMPKKKNICRHLIGSRKRKYAMIMLKRHWILRKFQQLTKLITKPFKMFGKHYVPNNSKTKTTSMS